MKNPSTRTPLLGCYRVEFRPGIAGIIEVRRRPDRFLELVTHGKGGYDTVLRMATSEELQSIGAKHALQLCDGVCVWLEESSGAALIQGIFAGSDAESSPVILVLLGLAGFAKRIPCPG
jgi:hypothetical protein